MSLQRRDRGFMLLEVVLSMAIIASSLVFIIRSYVVSLRATETSRRMQKACLMLEEKLFELDAKGSIEEGASTGEFEGGVYSWQLIAAPIDDKKKINAATLEVSRTTGAANRIKISTYIKNKTT